MLVIINFGFILGLGIGGFMVEVLYCMLFYFVGVLGILVFIMLIVLIYDLKKFMISGF